MDAHDQETTEQPYDSGPPREQHNNTAKIETNQSQPSILLKRWRVTSRPHRLIKTSSMQSKRRDLNHKWPHRETNDNTWLLTYLFLLCFFGFSFLLSYAIIYGMLVTSVSGTPHLPLTYMKTYNINMNNRDSKKRVNRVSFCFQKVFLH